MDYEKLMTSLIKHEGFRGTAYTDTVGKQTIGYGRNLTDNPLTEEEGKYLMFSILHESCHRAKKLVANWETLNDVRQNVLIEMVYNIGWVGVFGFKQMRGAIEANNFVSARLHMLNSKWATQVGQRARTLADMMETGEWV
jgi:lysozyme